jgi:uncharacterized protein (TIGR03437 family)
VTTAVPPQVRSEGLAERLGDIVLQCSGSNPGAVATGNFTVYLPVSVTNRIDSNNLTTDAVLSVDYGLGFTPIAVSGLVNGSSISFNGVTVTVPASGNFNLKFSNIRVNAHQLGGGAPTPILANLSVPLQINNAQIVVAYATAGLFSTLYSKGVTCTGSPVPSTIDLGDLFAAKTVFFSTRVTEGFGSAFAVQGSGDTNGTRFVVKYSSFPANAHLYVPNMVAGSDAAVPTAGGDLGTPQNPGQYVPGSGTLLLVLVQGANSSGAGGTPLPVPTGSAAVALNAATEVPLTNGSGFAVYEVADSNTTLIESAQFPTFLGLSNVTAPAVAQETISLGPISIVQTASASATVPRFSAITPGSDCSIIGDCQASYFPKLNVVPLPIQLTAVAGGAMTSLPGYVYVQNTGGGIMDWTATVTYGSGSGWLTLYQPTSQNSATIRVDANARGLAAGTYQATITIDAGPLTGSASIPVTLTVAAPSPAPQITVKSVVNAATFASTPLVAGSLATIMGSNFSGKNVAVTFDGTPATLLYTSDGQLNLQVPAGIGSKPTTTMIVTVDGLSSAPQTVPLAPAWPAIFNHGILNQDYSQNSASAPAPAGSVLQIFATGIPSGATVTAQIQDRSGLIPMYAGPAPDIPGVQQVNVAVPSDLTTQTTQLVLCASVGGQSYCSSGSALSIQ